MFGWSKTATVTGPAAAGARVLPSTGATACYCADMCARGEAMGKPMARNLLRAGYPLILLTRTRAKAEDLQDHPEQAFGKSSR